MMKYILSNSIKYLTAVIILFPSAASGNGDHDHSVGGQSSTGITPYVEGETSNFEVVVTYDNVVPNEETTLTVYVSDWTTNEPIANANVDLDIAGVDNATLKKRPVTMEGVYVFDLVFPEIRNYNFLIGIEKAGVSDLIVITDVDISKTSLDMMVTVESDEFLGLSEVILLFILFSMLLIAASVFFYRVGRRSRRKHPAEIEKVENKSGKTTEVKYEE
jgi:hypothetical protein